MNNDVQMKKELLLFEWVVIDNCNLFCGYCVNKGAYSHKQKSQMMYVDGCEIQIAQKIKELSTLAHKVIVNLTGGEPLLATHIEEVFQILSESGNVYINLITNMKLLEKHVNVIERLVPYISLTGSLHAHYRSDNEIDTLIALLKEYNGKFPLTLTQVDYELNPGDIEKISRIKAATGLDVLFQTFIPPWTDTGKIDNEVKIRDANFVTSRGKRCCLGYSHFFILPDATFYYDLWCQDGSRKTGNFLDIGKETLDLFILKEMKKCHATSCGCNYNILNYPEYIQACERHGYPDSEVFGKHNTRMWQRILRWYRRMKTS